MAHPVADWGKEPRQLSRNEFAARFEQKEAWLHRKCVQEESRGLRGYDQHARLLILMIMSVRACHCTSLFRQDPSHFEIVVFVELSWNSVLLVRSACKPRNRMGSAKSPEFTEHLAKSGSLPSPQGSISAFITNQRKLVASRRQAWRLDQLSPQSDAGNSMSPPEPLTPEPTNRN
jgi:hypothetical protein